MAAGSTAFPARRAAAERNRELILDTARDAFADGGTEISMAEIARRAGVGMATLYRNFPGRQELLEALYANEVDALCAAAADDAPSAGAALDSWLRRLFAFIPTKRLIVAELLEHPGGDVRGHRGRALETGRALLVAAQEQHEARDDITIEQIFDLVVAIARIDAEPDHLRPMVDTMLDGLARRQT